MKYRVILKKTTKFGNYFIGVTHAMIGNTLKQLLAKRKIGVGELARRIQVPAQTLYSIIRRDNMKIDFDVLLRICDVLEVPVDVFCGDAGNRYAPVPEELALLRHYRELDDHGRATAELVIDRERERVRQTRRQEPGGRLIPLFLTSADCRADFAVRIDGDSMEPVIRDGSVVLVQRSPIENGDVGMLFIDGDMKCKRYCRDNYSNIYLLSLNRDRADADVTVPASSGVTLCCFGKVLLERRPPLPV